ncbi:MAG: elongation factor P hydroxylase [Oceanicoccus sp.]
MTLTYTSTSARSIEPCADDLIELFDHLFESSENTRLVRGAAEPIYIPASKNCGYHQVSFAHGYFSSALHELAHWCVAGKERRLLLDYGYWYAPDGRDSQQQVEFEKVEVKPQALEWIFSKCCGKKFNVSTDNLNGVETDSQFFKTSVYQQVLQYCEVGLPSRAKKLCDRLSVFYQNTNCVHSGNFSIDELN